ncbi:MAG: prepilin-type N-terminal cleavage/methylation domain-containing protein [Caldimonas sp.]
MRRRSTRARSAGFTLIEVLVAMVVMAIMSLMAWQGVDGIVRSRESNQVRLEQTLRLETVMAQWEQDLASLQRTTAVPPLSCDGQSVRMTRRTDDGLQVVVWSLRPDSHGYVWQRWAGPSVTTTNALQETWLRTQQFQGSETGQLRALTGLEAWQVYFFQGAWANCQSSLNAPNTSTPTGVGLAALNGATAASGAAPTTGTIVPQTVIPATNQLQSVPTGVRVVLAFAPGSGLVGNLTRDSVIAP